MDESGRKKRNEYMAKISLNTHYILFTRIEMQESVWHYAVLYFYNRGAVTPEDLLCLRC